MLNAGQVLTRALIFDRVWGYDFGSTSTSFAPTSRNVTRIR
jgi:hypothetical protein